MQRSLGFWAVFALVVGSQVGSGIFMLPTSLAPFGLWSLAGWLISGGGAILLALVFAKLCHWHPKTGGPHVYVEAAFGRKAAFFTGWTYWVISWVSTTAVIIATVGYLSPIFYLSPHGKLLAEIIILTAITLLNLRGVKLAGQVEFLLTLLKVVPLLIVPIAALSIFKVDNFAMVATDSVPVGSILKQTALLTLWGFIGVESATTLAGNVKDAGRIIPKAVISGTLFVALLYVINSTALLGAVPGAQLAHSLTPYADVAAKVFGSRWHVIIALIAAVICIGTFNAWMLASGQVALGLAKDKLLPDFFAHTNEDGAPIWGIVLSAIGMLPFLLLTTDNNLAQRIELIVNFSVIAFIIVDIVCVLSFFKLLLERKKVVLTELMLAIMAFLFCSWILLATDLTTLLLATSFTISGYPLYCYMQYKKSYKKN